MAYMPIPRKQSGDVFRKTDWDAVIENDEAIAAAIPGLPGSGGFTSTGTDGNLVRATGSGIENVPGASPGRFCRFNESSHAEWVDPPVPSTAEDIAWRYRP